MHLIRNISITVKEIFFKPRFFYLNMKFISVLAFGLLNALPTGSEKSGSSNPSVATPRPNPIKVETVRSDSSTGNSVRSNDSWATASENLHSKASDGQSEILSISSSKSEVPPSSVQVNGKPFLRNPFRGFGKKSPSSVYSDISVSSEKCCESIGGSVAGSGSLPSHSATTVRCRPSRFSAGKKVSFEKQSSSISSTISSQPGMNRGSQRQSLAPISEQMQRTDHGAGECPDCQAVAALCHAAGEGIKKYCCSDKLCPNGGEKVDCCCDCFIKCYCLPCGGVTSPYDEDSESEK